MKDILQRVEKVFNENILIGNHDFTEDEYSMMLEHVGILSNNFDNSYHKLIFATLVEIAKRWKQTDISESEDENSGYWGYVFKVLFDSDIDQQLCQKYRDTISYLDKNCNVSVVSGGQKYYATLMMHSFAPKKSIYSFFDLCYNVFKRDLDFGFTSDDEWLCSIVAEQMKNVLGGGYREDKLVSIGSSAYSIKIGLRSFALKEDLSVNFINLIKDTFYQINKLFILEKITEDTRLKQIIVEWWKNKTESEKLSEDATRKKRVITVSKQNIIAKYIRDDKDVILLIPSIRLEGDIKPLRLAIFANQEQIHSEEMRTKRGELVVATKQGYFILNDLLKEHNSMNLRVEIKENETVIFDSEKSKTTSLNREFILFDGEKEIFSQIIRPTNYFVYSKDIDALKSVPNELTTIESNLYNIYPSAGESLIGETKQVFFVDKAKSSSLGKTACLIGNIIDVEWILDDISCVVYGNSVKLMIPENMNLRALELRIDKKQYKIQEFKYEQIECNCYQVELKALGLISECYPTEISLYSYETETTILQETIIVYPNLEIKLNKALYYGDINRKVTLIIDNESTELSWSNQDNEIKYTLDDGILLIKIPYLRWRINDREWSKEPINRKLWYKDFLKNGDLLEIDNPKEDEEDFVYGKVDGKLFEISKNINGKFEIGRAIYANEKKTEISLCYSNNRDEKFALFTLATEEHFIENPLSYCDEKVFWNVEETFIGDKDNEFFLIVESEKNDLRTKINNSNCEIKNLHDDICKIQVKIKNNNIFSKQDTYESIFEGELSIGRFEKLRLPRVAKEFNISVQTIIHSLKKRGFQLNFTPNSKLTSDMYLLLKKEFQFKKNEKTVGEEITHVLPRKNSEYKKWLMSKKKKKLN